VLLQEDYVAGNCSQQELYPLERYRYEAPVSFHTEGGRRYWFSVQAELSNLPQWGRLGSETPAGHNSAFRSEFFGYPDWIDAAEVGGEDGWDASQEFACYSAVEIEHLVLDSTDQEDVSCVVDAAITAYECTLDPDLTWMEYRTSRPGLWTRVNMLDIGGGHWQASIPGQEQPKEVSYYIHAGDIMGNSATDPPGGREAPHGFDVAWLVHSFEEGRDGDFVVDPDGDDDATRGIWEYADLDTGYAYAYEPAQDHTRAGSKCWITARGADDVDGGKTTLQSASYDLTGATIAEVKYWRWYSGSPYQSGDNLLVQVRNDGGPWTDIENNPDPAEQWLQVEYDLYQSYGAELGDVEFRFTVSHEGDNQIVEAALDDFVVLTNLESVVSTPAGGENRRSTASCQVVPNPFHSETTIRFGIPSAAPVRLTVHDVSGRLVATLIDGLETDAGFHQVLWNGMSDQGSRLQSGIYYVRLDSGSLGARRHLLLFK